MNIHGDNHTRSGQLCPLNDVYTYTAAADHHDCAARLHFGTMDHRSYTCRHRATSKYRSIQRKLLVYHHQRYIRDNSAFAEGGEQAELTDVRRGAVHAEGSIQLRPERCGCSFIAQIEVAGETIAALATSRNEAKHNMVTRFAIRDIRPNCLDDVSPFVAQGHG